MGKVVTIDEAIEEIKKKHDSVKVRPLIVGVHGAGPASGKTYFCKQAVNKLLTPGRLLGNAEVTKKNFKEPDSGIDYDGIEYLLFDVGYNYPDPGLDEIYIWDLEIWPNFGRTTDMNLVIFNPNYQHPDERRIEVFDLIVLNPGAKLRTRKEADLYAEESRLEPSD